MLENLISDIFRANQQLPLQYGQMYGAMYAPMYQFYDNQGRNATSIGNQAISAYGQAATLDQDANRFNSLAPVLSSLLGQYSPKGMSFNIAPIQPMAQMGLRGFTRDAYNEAGRYGRDAERMFEQQRSVMPRAPYMGDQSDGGGFGGPLPLPSYMQSQSNQRYGRSGGF